MLRKILVGLAAVAISWTAASAAQAQTCSSSCSLDCEVADTFVYYEPLVANARKGDLLLTEGQSGPVAAIIQNMGQSLVHSGVFIDDGVNVRHTTMDIDNVDQLTDEISFFFQGSIGSIFGASGYGDVTLNATDLYNGMPGTCVMNPTGTVYCDGLKHEWSRSRTNVLRAIGSSNTVARRIADNSVGNDGYYRLYAYMDTEGECSRLNGTRSGDPGCMCSGLVDESSNDAGYDFIQPQYYSSSSVRSAATAAWYNIRSMIEDIIHDQVGGWDWLVSDRVIREAAEGVADQVINCWMEGTSISQCNQINNGWRYLYRSASAVSPDDLANQAMANPNYEAVLTTPQWEDGGWTMEPEAHCIDCYYDNSYCYWSWIGAGDGCDCGCGVYDPDCGNNNRGFYTCDWDAYGTSAFMACPSSWIGGGDGCDCGCQVYDPDCG